MTIDKPKLICIIFYWHYTDWIISKHTHTQTADVFLTADTDNIFFFLLTYNYFIGDPSFRRNTKNLTQVFRNSVT